MPYTINNDCYIIHTLFNIAYSFIVSSIGGKAPVNDFLTSQNLDLLSSSSKEPSRTIKISPIVPKMGRIGVKS